MRFLETTSPDVNNGLGFRVTLWVAGCNHHCKGCQNQHTWDYNQGMVYSEIRNKLFDLLSKEYIKGLTLSGGDPLSQTDDSLLELSKILDEIKTVFPEKDIWIFAGDTYEEAIQTPNKRSILDKCSVMIDGVYKCQLRNTSLAFRGSSNQRIIDLEKTRETGNVVLKLLD